MEYPLHGITSIECLYTLHSSFFEADGHRWSASGQESQGATNERNPAEGGPRRHENRGSRWVGLKPSFRKKGHISAILITEKKEILGRPKFDT